MVNHNHKRSAKLSFLVRKNWKLASEIKLYVAEKALTVEESQDTGIIFMNKLKNKVGGCASYTLYRAKNPALFSSFTCDSKACMVCNWKREKAIRRKYKKFFEQNERLYFIDNQIYTKSQVIDEETNLPYPEFAKRWEVTDIKTGEIFQTTSPGKFSKGEKVYLLIKLSDNKTTIVKPNRAKMYESNLKYKIEIQDRYIIEPMQIEPTVSYDLFHLVLTVPHTKENGFLGNQIYYREFKEAFKKLRNLDFWKLWVYGGEFGIETTNGKDHVVCVDVTTGKEKEMSKFKYEKLQREGKANNLLLKEKKFVDSGLHIHAHALLLARSINQSRNHLHKLIFEAWNKLTIDLNNERREFNDFHIQQICKGNKMFTPEWVNEKIDPRGSTFVSLESIYTIENGVKVYGKEGDLMKAILETIKYHFEPQAFEKHGGKYDLDLLYKILPAIHKQKLYERFGCLLKDKTLRIVDSSSDLTAEFDETAENSTIEKSGEVEKYYLGPAGLVWHNQDQDNEIVFSRKFKNISHEITAEKSIEAITAANYIYGKMKKAPGDDDLQAEILKVQNESY